MTGAQSDSIGTDVRIWDPIAGDESEGPITPPSQEVGLVFGSDADECATSVAESIHPSMDGATGSELRLRAAADVIS